MEIAEKDVAVAPDLNNLLGLLCENFYPQYERLNKVNEIKWTFPPGVSSVFTWIRATKIQDK